MPKIDPMAVSEVTLRHQGGYREPLSEGLSSSLVSARCWPVKPKSSLRGFFISDRTDCVNSTPTPAVIEKRVQVRHEVCDPVQIRKNPATGRTSKSRVYGIQSVAWKSGMTGGDVQLCSYTFYGVGGSLGDNQENKEIAVEEFETFWKVYPRKVAKAEARKAWAQVERIRPDLKTIISAVQAACKTEQWMRAGGQFIPYAATWLRGERWEDSYEVVIPDVVNEKPWYETSTGIEAKGRELGLDPQDYEHFPAFKAAVMRATMRAA